MDRSRVHPADDKNDSPVNDHLFDHAAGVATEDPTPATSVEAVAESVAESSASSGAETREETTSTPKKDTPEGTCPQCGKKLFNPEGLGWCASCGYCRSLQEEKTKIALPSATPHKPSFLGIAEFAEMLTKLPSWFWVLLTGSIVIAAMSFAADLFLPPEGLPRALWSTIQLGLGLLLIFLAQVWAMFLLVADYDNLGPKDLILSFRLWTTAMSRLPLTRKPVWLGGWAAVAALCAVFLVGGFSYWAQFYKPKKVAPLGLRDLAQALADKGDSNKSLAESVEDFAKTQDLTKKDEKEKEKKEDFRPVAQCVVIGYTIDEASKMLSGLVLATVEKDKLRYAGTVRQGFSLRASEELLERLKPLVRSEPLIRNLNLKFEAIWVKPGVFCEVLHSGPDENGRLARPEFKGILD